MDIYWYGQSCFRIKGKNTTVLIDPFDPEFTGLKLPKDLEANLVLITHQHQDHNFKGGVNGKPVVIEGPGEYEIGGVSVVGMPAFHDNVSGAERGQVTIYQVVVDDVSIVHVGDLGQLPSEEQTSLIDRTDILMVPVGGLSTIDGEAAAKVVATFEAKIVLPMHYMQPGLKFELNDVAPFLKEMGAENIQPVPKLSITKDKLPEATTVVVLNKS